LEDGDVVFLAELLRSRGYCFSGLCAESGGAVEAGEFTG
jgi:hypothetical protein